MLEFKSMQTFNHIYRCVNMLHDMMMPTCLLYSSLLLSFTFSRPKFSIILVLGCWRASIFDAACVCSLLRYILSTVSSVDTLDTILRIVLLPLPVSLPWLCELMKQSGYCSLCSVRIKHTMIL